MIRRGKLILFLIAFCANATFAQLDNSIYFNHHANQLQSFKFPSKIGLGFDKMAFILPSISTGLANDFVEYNKIRDLLSKELLNEEIEAVIASMNTSNLIYNSNRFTLFGFSYKLPIGNLEEGLSLQFSVSDEFSNSFLFSKNLAKTLYEGNTQFAGQWVDLTPIKFDMLYFRNWSFGASSSFQLGGGVQIRPGLNLRYLNGIANIETLRNRVSYYTEEEGRFIRLILDYDINTNIPDNASKVLWGDGSGFAADIGATVKYDDFLTVDFAINDLGFIKFNRNSEKFRIDEDVTYRGVDLDIWEQDVEQISIIDTLQELIEANETPTSYSVNLPPKLNFMLSLGFGQMEEGLLYHHNIYLMYEQGFQNELDASTKAIVALAYTYSLNAIFNIGPNFTFGGYQDIAFGVQASVKGGPFVFSIGSSNLNPLFFRDQARGVDGGMAFMLLF